MAPAEDELYPGYLPYGTVAKRQIKFNSLYPTGTKRQLKFKRFSSPSFIGGGGEDSAESIGKRQIKFTKFLPEKRQLKFKKSDSEKDKRQLKFGKALPDPEKRQLKFGAFLERPLEGRHFAPEKRQLKFSQLLPNEEKRQLKFKRWSPEDAKEKRQIKFKRTMQTALRTLFQDPRSDIKDLPTFVDAMRTLGDMVDEQQV